MNLKSIEYFLVTVEEMNITRAAERLFISQQALSSHLKRLEDEYGVCLFDRKPSLRLTLEGEQMAFYGKRIVQAEADLRAAFSDICKNHRGVLRVGISRLRSSVFFPVIWEFYHDSHPNISVELINGNSNTFEEQLQAGKLDLYIGVDVGENANRERIELTRERCSAAFGGAFKGILPGRVGADPGRFPEGSGSEADPAASVYYCVQETDLRKDRCLFSTCSLPQYVFECDEQGWCMSWREKEMGRGFCPR